MTITVLNKKDTIKDFLYFVHILCENYLGSETSGARTEEHNRAVGGHPKSKHMFEYGWGLARDIIFDDYFGMRDAIPMIQKAGYHYLDYPDENRLHIQLFGVGVSPPEDPE